MLNTLIRPAATVALLALPLLLAGCSRPDSGETDTSAEKSQPASQAEPISAPAGTYDVDHNHATLAFSIKHLGLSNYIARFTDYTASIEMDPENLEAASVEVTIDPTSVRTDYAADYEANHPDSPFQSWNEDLARSDKFFNANEYPEITFRSTDVERTGANTLEVTGDLTLLGRTRPVTLEAEITGSTATHPLANTGAIGFSARGTFKRSAFGMDHLLSPPLVGDEVTLKFDGEFLQRGDNGGDISY